MALRIQDFQRNTAFLLFVVVVTGACLLFVLEKLRSVLTPVIWAFFFAIPILAFAARVETLTNLCFAAVTNHICGHAIREVVSFEHIVGRNSIHLDRRDASNSAAADALLQALSSRCSRRIRAGGCWSRNPRCSRAGHCLGRMLIRLDRSFLSCFWGQRVKITRLRLARSDRSEDHHRREVGGLAEGESYYASWQHLEDGLLMGDSEATSVELRLFLDRQQMYPAVLETDDRDSEERFHGTLEVDQRTLFSWIVSMLITLCLCVLLICGFVHMCRLGVQGVQSKFGDYKKGVLEMLQDIKNLTKSLVPKRAWDQIQKQATEKLTEIGKDIAQASVLFAEDLAGQIFLFFLYLLFWIFEPLPVNEPVAKVFKDYLALKTIVCLLFAGIMAALLACLSCPLWTLYFILAFLLNYIPEIGPLLTGILMLPAVLLDGGLSRSVRYTHATALVIVGVCAKILTGNVIEVDLYSRFGGEFMRIHPVVLFVFFTFCGYELGVTGMFISIPILAAFKYSLVSQALPDKYLHPLLIFIEGDAWAPHRNRLERQKAIELKFRPEAMEQTAGV